VRKEENLDISHAAYHRWFEKSTSNSLDISDSLSGAAALRTAVCSANVAGHRDDGRQQKIP
jgi:hypothetical protein